ncbi:MAG TPA: ECF-type sigma factor, partial [Pyrinomonadaceae bacterium]|nr:ECF-type sigma factor [Pyrinomonadaceae bacterium]
MTASAPQDITRLLFSWREGDDAALDQLVPLVYPQLRQLARRYLRRENPEHSLQTSALINEAYLRLVDQQDIPWKDRAH